MTAPPLGSLVAMGQCIVEGEGQVYFDILGADASEVPVAREWLDWGAWKALGTGER